ncbi:MAG TPA: hypothetical protein EYP90_13105 [Chromatiaceae bacterium]|nr:hypothetical protein [Chromatiaceae bacterium]
MAQRNGPFERALKKARTGKHWKRREAVAVLERLNDSGMTVAGFAREYQLKEKRLRYWRKQLEHHGARQPVQPEFVALQVVEPHAEGLTMEAVPPQTEHQEPPALEVVLRAGRAVRVPAGFDQCTLARVVEVLERVPC